MSEDEKPTWDYKSDGETSGDEADKKGQAHSKSRHQNDAVSWEASEFIENHHSPVWYFLLMLGTAVLTAGIYLISKDVIASAVIIVVGVIVAVFATQKPSIAKYEITSSGLSVNGKLYPYGSYKSFAVIREGALSSINLFPLKRFMPPVSAYFATTDQDKIIDTIGNYLPYEDRQLDAVDRLTRRLHL